MYKCFLPQKIIVYTTLLFLIFTISCRDIFEPDISNSKVILIAPSNNLITKYNTQTFWWNNVNDAIVYDLQIVSPSFSSVEKIIIDTIVSTNKFSLSLYPGKFEWRVKAMNGSSETAFYGQNLEIDSTMDLSGQKILLIYPISKSYINLNTIIFNWSKLYNANKYAVKIINDLTGVNIFNKNTTTYDTIVMSNLAEGSYTWDVQALNNDGATSIFSGTFNIDRTPPGTPVVVSPLDKAILTNSLVTLHWNRIEEKGVTIFDSVFLARDSTFATSKIIKQLPMDVDSLQVTLDPGIYFWRVKTIDEANNQSGFEPVWNKFTVKIN